MNAVGSAQCANYGRVHKAWVFPVQQEKLLDKSAASSVT
jgi:hypothetical protein